MSAVITRGFLQTTRKTLSSWTGKTVESIRICVRITVGAHLTPASWNIIRQFHNASFAAAVAVCAHIKSRGRGKKSVAMARRETRVFLRLNSRDFGRASMREIYAVCGEIASDTKGNKTRRNVVRNTKIVITKIYRAREVFRPNNNRSAMLPMVINSLCFGELTAFSDDINKAVFCESSLLKRTLPILCVCVWLYDTMYR